MKKAEIEKIPVPLPIILEKGNKYVSAWCPVLDIATQGATEEEAKKNMNDLIEWYYEDKDTIKPEIKTMMGISISIATIPVQIQKRVDQKNETSNPVIPRSC